MARGLRLSICSFGAAVSADAVEYAAGEPGGGVAEYYCLLVYVDDLAGAPSGEVNGADVDEYCGFAASAYVPEAGEDCSGGDWA